MLVGDVFGALDHFTPVERFGVAVCVWDRERCFPRSLDDLAALPLPLLLSGWERLRRALSEPLTRLVDDSGLSQRTVGDVAPALCGLDVRIETERSVSQRLLAAAQLHRCRTWHDVSERTIGEVRGWRGVGAKSAALLVIAGLDAAWSRVTMPQGRFGDGTLFGGAVGSAPADTSAHGNAGRRKLLDELIGWRDIRQRVVFELVELGLDTEPNLSIDDAAVVIGLGAERTRQFRSSGRAAARELPAQSAEILELSEALRADLGALTDAEHLDLVLTSHGFDEGRRSPAALLAVWLAGPYRPVPGHVGWWAVEPSEATSETTALLRRGGGVHSRGALIDDIARLGIDDSVAERWLARQPAICRPGDLVVWLGGRVAEIASRILEASGEGLTAAEIVSVMPTAELRARTPAELHRNPMFVRTGADLWELAEWGGAPSRALVRLDIAVTAAVFDGAEDEAPHEVAGLLGLRPGRRVVVSTRFGPLSFTFDGTTVRRGSVRPIVLASGAKLGDLLLVVFDHTGSIAAIDVEAAT